MSSGKVTPAGRSAVIMRMAEVGHVGGKAAAIEREPVPLGEVEEHGGVAAVREQPARRQIRFQPPLFQQVAAVDAADAILAIQNVVGAAVIGQHGIDAGRP